ncbi:hypothetical protein C4D27_15900 [Clostridium perfringens]
MKRGKIVKLIAVFVVSLTCIGCCKLNNTTKNNENIKVEETISKNGEVETEDSVKKIDNETNSNENDDLLNNADVDSCKSDKPNKKDDKTQKETSKIEENNENNDKNDKEASSFKENKVEKVQKAKEPDIKETDKNEANKVPKNEVKEAPKPKENTEPQKSVSNQEEDVKFSSDFADKGERFSNVEDAIFKYVNQERVANGLNPFIRDSKLDYYARCKSYDMGAREYFEHKDKDGVRVWNHIIHDHYMQCGNWGENIVFTNYVEDEKGNVFLNFTDDQLGKYMVDCWMKSPGHRANILNPKFDRMGVGVKQIKQSDVPTYFGTQEFSHIVK